LRCEDDGAEMMVDVVSWRMRSWKTFEVEVDSRAVHTIPKGAEKFKSTNKKMGH
jgi:hypothetical protein